MNIANSKQEDVWVLVDNRTGTANQAIALAENLPFSYSLKKIEYNILGNLPNFVIGGTNFFINKDKSDSLNAPYPKMVIAAGRRLAALALYIKKQNPSTKLVHLLKPDLPASVFDLVVLSQHDKHSYNTKNIAYIIGALNNVKPKLTAAAEEFSSHYPHLYNNFIAVIIGGSTKTDDFTPNEIDERAAQIADICSNHGMPAVISFSRRTSNIIKQAFIKRFEWPHVIFDPTTPKGDKPYNPYLGMLACAKFVVCSGDSVCMCSEAAATEKPIYVFLPQYFRSKKHRYFLQQLLDLEMIRMLDRGMDLLSEYTHPALNEMPYVTQRVKELFMDK